MACCCCPPWGTLYAHCQYDDNQLTGIDDRILPEGYKDDSCGADEKVPAAADQEDAAGDEINAWPRNKRQITRVSITEKTLEDRYVLREKVTIMADGNKIVERTHKRIIEQARKKQHMTTS